MKPYLVFVLLLPFCLHAQEEARMTVVAEDVETELVSHSDGAVFKSYSKPNSEGTHMLNGLEVTMPTSDSEWQPLTLTFKAVADAKVTLQLGGGRGGKNHHILFDKIEATGVAIENPDFETKGQRAPRGWKAVNWAEDQDQNAAKEGLAASGSDFARINGKAFITQSFSVPKDTEVTITVQIRSGAD